RALDLQAGWKRVGSWRVGRNYAPPTRLRVFPEARNKKAARWAARCTAVSRLRNARSSGQLGWLLAPAGLELVVLQAVFVAHHLAIEFVHQLVNCSVQVLVGTFGKQVAALDANVAFGALSFF